MLIDNSLMIEDNSQSTMIVERISVIFSIINKQRASFKQNLKQILKKENEADFHAQMKLFSKVSPMYLIWQQIRQNVMLI